MKTRSEVLREKKQKRAKPSAEERTLPLSDFSPGTVVTCGECGEDWVASACTRRSDGRLECGGCGAPVDVSVAETAPEEAPAATDAPVYCGECGAEWTIANGVRFTTCKHPKSETVLDPRQAKNFKPPPGIGHRSVIEAERRDAEDAAAAARKGAKDAPASPPAPTAPPATAGASTGAVGPKTGTRLSIVWGEARFPLDQFNGFKVGGHILSVDVAEGEEVAVVAHRVVADLERIADELFERERAWYEKKLGLLTDK